MKITNQENMVHKRQRKKQKTTKKAPASVPRAIHSLKSIGATPRMYRLSTRYVGALNSSGAGVMTNNIPANDPSVCTDWTSLSALYDSFRVEKTLCTYYPNFNNASPTGAEGNFAPLFICYDVDTTTSPTSVDVALQYQNCEIKDMTKPWKYLIKNVFATDNSVNNAGMQISFDKKYGMFYDVANVANYKKGVIGWYGDNFTASINYGYLIVDYVVTFYKRR